MCSAQMAMARAAAAAQRPDPRGSCRSLIYTQRGANLACAYAFEGRLGLPGMRNEEWGMGEGVGVGVGRNADRSMDANDTAAWSWLCVTRRARPNNRSFDGKLETQSRGSSPSVVLRDQSSNDG